MKKPIVAVLFGGESDEHEISLLSAEAVFTHINYEKWAPLPIGITQQGDWFYYKGNPRRLRDGAWQRKKRLLRPVTFQKNYLKIGNRRVRVAAVLPVLHGGGGEHGAVQGLLESLHLPYCGCGVCACAVGMDKACAAALFEQHGIPCLKSVCIQTSGRTISSVCQDVCCALDFPLFIKPACGGSSLGATAVFSEADLQGALRYAQLYDTRILAQPFVRAKECEVAVLEQNGALTISAPGEIETNATFYDFHTKYKSSATALHVPARIPCEAAQSMMEYARRAFLALSCRGICRCDFFLCENGDVYLNEVNTLPGLTDRSLYPALLAHEGISFAAMIDALLEGAT